MFGIGLAVGIVPDSALPPPPGYQSEIRIFSPPHPLEDKISMCTAV